MESTLNRPLCQQNPATITPRVTIDLAEVYNSLSSQFTLSEVQIKEVEGLLLAADKDLDDYNSEILRLQSQIAYIETRKARLDESAHRLRCLMSPVRRLPNEILCRIFDYSCETNLLQEFPWGSDTDDPSTTISAPALTYLPAMAISSVCARWRSIAVSLPSLWSRISLEVLFEGASLSGFISAIELHLSRSGDHPLELTVNVHGYEFDHHLSILNILLCRCRRWHSFRLLGAYSFTELVSPLIDHPLELPLLEELESEAYAGAFDLKHFEGAPMIHSLTMGAPNDSLARNLPLLRNILTVLDVPSSWRSIDKVLDDFPNLTEVCLRERPGPLARAMDGCIPPKQYDTVASLSLVLAQDNYQDGRTALQSLTFPSLIDLRLEVSDYAPRTDAWSANALVAFLRRSKPSNLTTFSVRSVVLTDSDLVTALKFMPFLTDLTIDDFTVPSTESPITPRLISSHHRHAFTLHPNNTSRTVLLPKLRCLKLYFGGTSFDDVAFIDMVSSRWLPDAEYASAIGMNCLRTLVMNFRTRAVDEKVYQPLHLLDKSGMMATVISEGRTLI